jgi:alpha-glucosidase
MLAMRTGDDQLPLDPESAAPWWQTSVVYQIYPRSFADSSADGVGDLEGIRSRLGHLSWLGVDAIWLSPFYPSPMADFGYDVSDYCGVDPLFGTLEDFDGLVADAHERGIRVLIDFVPNHTSDQHPWFQSSRSSRDDPKRDWYVWRDPAPDGGPPNNWVASLKEAPAWTFDETTGQYYLHLFLTEQPDLNWNNPDVVAAMHDALRFWLDRGVDGFRVDVVHAIGKDATFADDPAELVPIPHVALNHRPETHVLLRGIRRLLDTYPGDRMMVGEVYLLDTEMVATYYGAGDELNLAFNFPPLHIPWDAHGWQRQIEIASRALDPIDAWPTWTLSNHDHKRHRTRYGGSEARARASAVLLLGLRGTPFLYAGEELGLEDAEIPADRVVDPGGRDGCRAPIPWDATTEHGWGSTDPWLPWPPEADTRNVAMLRDDPASIAHLYRRLLNARRRSPALQSGDLRLLRGMPASALGWERVAADDARVVLVNFDDAPTDLPGVGGVVEVASDGIGEGEPFAGRLASNQALIVRASS